MDLIDLYGSSLESTFSPELQLSKALKSFILKCQHQGSVCRWVDNRLELNVAIRRSPTVELGGWMALDVNTHQLCLRVSTLNQRRSDSLYVASVLRLLHDLNSEMDQVTLKMHPLTGQLSAECCFMEAAPHPLAPNPPDLFDSLQDQLQNLRTQLLGCYIKIEALRKSCEGDIQSKESVLQADLTRLKRYIKASPFYAWCILEPNKQLKNSDAYTSLKRNYRRVRPYDEKEPDLKFSSLLSNLTGYSNTGTDRFFHLTKPEDDQIFQKYLLGEAKAPRSNNSSYQYVSLQQVCLPDIYKSEKIMIGDRRVRVRLAAAQSVAKEQHILQFLPQEKHKSLPKYFIIKQIPPQQQGFILTQDADVVKYTDYLENNKNILSVNTILLLLADIAKALLYLKNHEIVYNNLVPGNVKVGKGLNVMLEDLSNAYHKSMQDKIAKNPEEDRFLQPVNKLPYVINKYFNEDNAYMSESADVYSFGVLMYKSLFKKSLFSMGKNSSSIEKMVKRPPIFALEDLNCFGMDHFRLLAYFAMQATTHNTKQRDLVCQQKQDPAATECIPKLKKYSKAEQSQNRPYMDWLIVITEATLSYFERNLSKGLTQQEQQKFSQEVQKKMGRQCNEMC